MIVDHSDGLHECVANCCSDKTKAAALKVRTERIGFCSPGWNFPECIPPVHFRSTTHEGPNIGVESSKFLLNFQERLRVAHGGFDLQSVSDYAGIQHQFLDSCPSKSGNDGRIEVAERFPVIFALVQNGLPAQSCLRAFENQKLEKCPVIMNGHSPFLVVV